MSLAVADKLVCEDPMFSVEDKYFLTGEEAFETAMKKSVYFIKKSKELNLQTMEKNIVKR